MDCLKNIIGLSRSTCECYANTPDDAKESKSGFFLAELEGINEAVIFNAEDCDTGGIWDLLSKARENAILNFRTDLMAALLVDYKLKRDVFKGIIGEETATRTFYPHRPNAGVRIEPYVIKSGMMVLRRIGLLFTANADFTVSLYSNRQEDAIETYDVSAIAGKATYFTLPTPKELPLMDEFKRPITYFLLYKPSELGAALPKENKAWCGCGGSKPTWQSYAMVSGVELPNLDLIFNCDKNTFYYQNATYMNGLLLDVEFKCKTEEVICDSDGIDYETNPLARVMAKCIQLKGGELLLEYILASPELSRFTTLDRERMWGKRNHYRKEYSDRITYIASSIDINKNGCLECNGINDLIIGGVFS